MEGPSSSHSPPGFAEDSRSLARTTDCCQFNVSVVKVSDVSKIFVSWVTYSRSSIPFRVNFRKVWSWSVCAKERSDCLCLPRRVESKPKVISTTCRDWTYSWKLELQHLNAIIKVSFHLWFRRASYMCSINGPGAFHKIQRAWVSNLFSSCPFLCRNAFALHPRGLSRVGQDTGWQSAVVGHVQDFTDEPPCCKVPPRFTESWNRLKKDTHITRFAWHSHSHTRTSSHACLALIASVRLWSSTPRFSPLHLKSLQALWNRLTQPNLYSVPWDRFLPNSSHASHVVEEEWQIEWE